jgi:hypothetical protein
MERTARNLGREEEMGSGSGRKTEAGSLPVACSHLPLRLFRARLVFLGKLLQSPLCLRVGNAVEKPADACYLRPQKPSVVSHSG